MAETKNICPWCGVANPNDAVQCIQCGSDLNPRPKEAETPLPAADAPARRTERSSAANAAPAKSEAGAKKAPKREAKNAIQPGIVYAAIAAVVILGYLYLRSGKTEPELPQNTSFMQSDSTAQHLRSMEQYMAEHPGDNAALLSYANTLQDERQFPKAIAAYKKYLAAEPKNPDARTDMAISLFESGQPDAAVAELKKVLEASPKHQPAMFNLGVVTLNQGKLKESNEWFTRCAAVDPSTPLAARAQQLLSQHSSTNTNPK